MKLRVSVILMAIFVSLSVFAGCGKPAGGEYGPSISDAVMASEVDATTYEALEKTDVFSPDAPVIHVVANLRGAKADATVVKAEWVYIDQEIFIAEAEAVAEYSEGPVWFNLTKPDNGWPTGKYQVTLFADDDEMAVKFFRVE